MINVETNKMGHCYIISNKWILSSCHKWTEDVTEQHTMLLLMLFLYTTAQGVSLQIKLTHCYFRLIIQLAGK